MARTGLALHQIIDRLFGIRTHSRETETVSGTTGVTVQIAGNDPKRVSIVILNLSGNAIWISPNNRTSITRGIYLAPNGGSMSLTWDRDFELCCSEWHAISAAGGDVLYVLENIAE
jgi:hypothetical protein